MKSTKWSIGGWVIIVIGLVIAVRQVGSVWRLIKAGDRVRLAKTELSQAQTDNTQLKKRLSEVDTPEFIEKEARDKLGMGREGETILILPDQSSPETGTNSLNSEPNWKQWWNLYIRI